MIVYLATPYSHPDPAVMLDRFNKACEYAAKLMREGVHVYSPIAHTHPIAQYGLPKGWDFWRAYDREILKTCGALWVLRMEGWDQSKGIAGELAIAAELGLPVEYLDP